MSKKEGFFQSVKAFITRQREQKSTKTDAQLFHEYISGGQAEFDRTSRLIQHGIKEDRDGKTTRLN